MGSGCPSFCECVYVRVPGRRLSPAGVPSTSIWGLQEMWGGECPVAAWDVAASRGAADLAVVVAADLPACDPPHQSHLSPARLLFSPLLALQLSFYARSRDKPPVRRRWHPPAARRSARTAGNWQRSVGTSLFADVWMATLIFRSATGDDVVLFVRERYLQTASSDSNRLHVRVSSSIVHIVNYVFHSTVMKRVSLTRHGYHRALSKSVNEVKVNQPSHSVIHADSSLKRWDYILTISWWIELYEGIHFRVYPKSMWKVTRVDMI